MKVLLVSNYEGDRQHSMLGFASCLNRELPSRGCEPTRIAPTIRFGASRSARLGKWLAYIDKYAVFPRILRKAAAAHDVVHILDQGNAMYVRHVVDRPHLITCHDLLAVRASLGEIPGWSVSGTGRRYQALNLAGLKRARLIVADSEASRADAVRLTGLAPERVRLLYIGQVQKFCPVDEGAAREILKGLGINGRYFLHVGNNSPYKNRTGVVEIYLHLRAILGEDCPGLVMAGAEPSTHLLESIRQSDRDIHAVPGPSTEALAALYSRADALIFPSLLEGFGLPIIEAQSLGCPVFTSNRAPMTEVGGNAARYFDPEDPEGAAKIIASGLTQACAMQTAGVENVKRFSPGKMAQGYAKLYSEVSEGQS